MPGSGSQDEPGRCSANLSKTQIWGTSQRLVAVADVRNWIIGPHLGGQFFPAEPELGLHS